MKNKIFLGVKGVKTIAFLFLSLLMILPLSSCYNKENMRGDSEGLQLGRLHR